ncbi:MAG: glycosyl hydrolase [Armatimonadota bacterium]
MHRNISKAVIIASMLMVTTCAFAADALVSGWQKPPETAKPRTWWHWMHGNITKQGITRDLEAMKRVGIGGATIFNASLAPKGKVLFFTPEWHEMMVFAAKEANRLGLELSMHNSEGWSSSGGPWVKPVDAMKMLVYSETRVASDTSKVAMAQPYTRLNTYGDIAVIAFPTPAAEQHSMLPSATLTVAGSSEPLSNPQRLWDGDVNTTVRIPASQSDGGSVLDIEFKQPTDVRQLTLAQCVNMCDTITLEVATASGEWQQLGQWSGNMLGDRPDWRGSWPCTPARASHYRIIFKRPSNGRIELGELSLDGGARVPNIDTKTYSVHAGQPAQRQKSTVPAGSTINPSSVIDITRHMQADGSLDWRPASGDWTVIRFGWTPISVQNHPASEEGIGLEIDKLNYEAVSGFYKIAVGTIVKNMGPLAGTTLKNILIDSYETGPQNWTPGFEAIFKDHTKYSITPWMPALTGRYVGSDEQTERFLWDFRKTIGDRWAQVYYDAFRKLCHADGMLLESEPYGDGPINTVLNGALSDVPMTEFWAGTDGYADTTYQVASGAHIGGRRIIGAEAFTGNADSWEYGPFEIKRLGDTQWCLGVNRYVFHTTALQYDEKLPGMALGPHGMHFDRHNTWFEQSAVWMKYIARSQYLLQQGNFVADVLQLAEEGTMEGTDDLGLPFGWRSDRIVAPFLMRASVKNGLIVLPSGMSYRLLVLPSSGRLNVATLRKIRDLVDAGATVMGNPPTETPGLSSYPGCDAQLKAVANSLWGADRNKRKLNWSKVGKGLVLDAMPIQLALNRIGVIPDIKVLNSYRQVSFIHRRTSDADIYFVCNTGEEPVQLLMSFRTTGRIPELWHPDSGKTERATNYTSSKTTTTLPVRLDGTGSVFVVFRTKSTAPAPVRMVKQSVASAPIKLPLKILSAKYGVLGDDSRTMDVTQLVTKLIKANSLEMQASNTTFGRDPAGLVVKRFTIKYQLGNEVIEKNVGENTTILIQAQGPSLDAAWVEADMNGKLTLNATSPGAFQIAGKNNKITEISVKSLPTQTINSPWKVGFKPGWDAPASATFDKLIDWTKSEDQGIKYYSGTATYTTRFTVQKAIKTADQRVYLDLGKVCIFASVKLNGKDMGTLWKPPFRVDVTNALMPGSNVLELQVTNNWVNQLIRDQQRPADQKKTWLPWQVYNANSPLQTSGLLGPVKLLTEARIPLK